MRFHLSCDVCHRCTKQMPQYRSSTTPVICSTGHNHAAAGLLPQLCLERLEHHLIVASALAALGSATKPQHALRRWWARTPYAASAGARMRRDRLQHVRARRRSDARRQAIWAATPQRAAGPTRPADCCSLSADGRVALEGRDRCARRTDARDTRHECTRHPAAAARFRRESAEDVVFSARRSRSASGQAERRFAERFVCAHSSVAVPRASENRR